jgi:CRP/FNR family cyclic AMP-dependent transcriptional regulator
MANNKLDAFDPSVLFKRADAQAAIRDYPNKQAIFTQGDNADAIFCVQSGHVKLTVTSKNGKKAVLAILNSGEIFGEECLIRQALRISTATAIAPSTIARVNRAHTVRIIHQEPAFTKLFISHLLLRIERIEEEFVDQIFSSSERRLARILLLLAGSRLRSTTPEPVLLKVSQETLAEMVGTTRSRVSYFMNRFRDLGFIDYSGSLEVHPALLTFLTND